MKQLTYTRPHNLRRLATELRALADLAPVFDPNEINPETGQRTGALVARLTVSSNGTDVFLQVPDGANEATIAAVVAAHDPTPDPVPTPPDYGGDLQTPTEFVTQAATAVSNLRAYLALESPTQTQTVAVIRLLCRIAIYSIRRWLGG